MLRREFTLDAAIKRATLYVSARGFYEFHINGKRVSDELLDPGYTDYYKRIAYQTFDVTNLLQQGRNAIGALLGYGWYAGHMNLFDLRCIDGFFPQLIAQLEVELVDGRHVMLNTDGKWRTTLSGAILWSDLLDGEGYDSRKELPGWDKPGFDDHEWKPAYWQPRDEVALVSPRCQPIRAIQEMHPVSMKEAKPGVYVYDLGQEISGYCRLKVDGPAGTKITVRHSELISPDGMINVSNLWGVAAEDIYLLNGNGPQVCEPRFTYHGFRYIELTGLPQSPAPDTLVAINIRTDVATTGDFTCSNDLYNRIMTTARWTQWNMLFDVPTGCAGRAERLAWLGDIRPCVQTALFNMDTAAFFSKYTTDIRDEQTADGRYCDISPHAHLRGTSTCVGAPGWADAGVSLPWDEYVNFGDRRILEEHYDSAKRWVDFVHDNNSSLLWQQARGNDWGDWLSGGAPSTPKDVGSTAFFAHSADLVSRMAQALGRQEEAKRYQELFQGIRQAFVKNYVDAAGIIGVSRGQPVMRDVTGLVRSLVKEGKINFTVNNGVLGGDPAPGRIKNLHLITRHEKGSEEQSFTEDSQVEMGGQNEQPVEIISAAYGYNGSDARDAQGSYALALQFDLLDEPLRSLAARRLHELVTKGGHHPTTGFWSSVELLLALSNSGYNEDAASMLNQRTKPSWGYMVDNSTTFWESFDADNQNLSRNHWTHSAVGEWLWRNVAGINPDPANPGYQSIIIRPRPSHEVTSCQAIYNSIRGPIKVHWNLKDGMFTLDLTVPVGARADVYLPAIDPSSVKESGKPANESEGVKFLHTDEYASVFRVESGHYQFTTPRLD